MSTVGVTVAVPAQGQAGEAAIVDIISEDVRREVAPPAANQQAQEVAARNSYFVDNCRRRPDSEDEDTRKQQERRAKRLVSEKSLCATESHQISPVVL